jgi:hypothetical protein
MLLRSPGRSVGRAPSRLPATDTTGADAIPVTSTEATHDHTHSHDHPHDHPAEQLPESSGAGSVVVDIGGNVGAAVVTTPARLSGREIEIRKVGDEWAGVHVAVIPRHVESGTIHAALFPGLVSGGYQVRERFGPDDGPVLDIETIGGEVRRFAWPTD